MIFDQTFGQIFISMNGKNQKEEIITASFESISQKRLHAHFHDGNRKRQQSIQESACYCFESKEAILDEVLSRVEDPFETEICNSNAKDPKSAIIAINDKILKYILNHPDRCYLRTFP
ncbi:hypothetical protein [Leptospira adleri]|nr:hypothetical protein [Leptospira adleri]PJZ55141.1 hypothetical protein CH380_01080 [Leptospira adleri]